MLRKQLSIFLAGMIDNFLSRRTFMLDEEFKEFLEQAADEVIRISRNSKRKLGTLE